MNRKLAYIIALAWAVSSAHAAGLPLPDSRYAGIAASQQLLTADVASYSATENGRDVSAPPSGDGLNATVYGGLRWWRGNSAIGLEAETTLGATDFEQADDVCTDVSGACARVGLNSASLQSLGRARLVYAHAFSDEWLVFAAGGVSLSHAKMRGIWAKSVANDEGFAEGIASINHVPASGNLLGYNIGIGAEFRPAQKLTVRFEALYEDFNPLKFNAIMMCEATASTLENSASSSISVTNKTGFSARILRFGLSYDF